LFELHIIATIEEIFASFNEESELGFPSSRSPPTNTVLN